MQASQAKASLRMQPTVLCNDDREKCFGAAAYCIRQGAPCEHPSGKVKIDAAYVAVYTPIVREQLEKAGVRLAHMLDAALGK